MFSGTCYLLWKGKYYGARFVYYCSFKKKICEDRSENFEFDPPGAPLDFQPVLICVV